MSRGTVDTRDLIEQIVATVSQWDGIEPTPHRFAGTAFLLGEREVGHVHSGGLVDINFPKRIRDALVEEGRTGSHHVVPASGWTTFRPLTSGDVDHAVWLLRLSYLYQTLLVRRAPGGPPELALVDVLAELDDLAPSETVRGLFEPLATRAE